MEWNQISHRSIINIFIAIATIVNWNHRTPQWKLRSIYSFSEMLEIFELPGKVLFHICNVNINVMFGLKINWNCICFWWPPTTSFTLSTRSHVLHHSKNPWKIHQMKIFLGKIYIFVIIAHVELFRWLYWFSESAAATFIVLFYHFNFAAWNFRHNIGVMSGKNHSLPLKRSIFMRWIACRTDF